MLANEDPLLPCRPEHLPFKTIEDMSKKLRDQVSRLDMVYYLPDELISSRTRDESFSHGQ